MSQYFCYLKMLYVKFNFIMSGTMKLMAFHKKLQTFLHTIYSVCVSFVQELICEFEQNL